MAGEVETPDPGPAADPKPKPKRKGRAKKKAGKPHANLPKIGEQVRYRSKILEETFAAYYVVSGMNGAQAYQRINPNVNRAVAAVKASELLARPQVRARVEELIGALVRGATEELRDLIAQYKADIDTTPVDFLEHADNIPVVTKDGVEYVSGYRFNLDAAREDRAKAVSIRSVTIRDGQITKIDMVDRQRAQDALTKLIEVYHEARRANEDGKGTGRLAEELRERQARAKGQQLELAKRLAPPQNVSKFRIVDGKLVTTSTEVVPLIPAVEPEAAVARKA